MKKKSLSALIAGSVLLTVGLGIAGREAYNIIYPTRGIEEQVGQAVERAAENRKAVKRRFGEMGGGRGYRIYPNENWEFEPFERHPEPVIKAPNDGNFFSDTGKKLAEKGDGYASVRDPCVVYVNGTYYQYYYSHLCEEDNRKICVATSTDGYNYKEYKGNPILLPTKGTWDYSLVGRPGVCGARLFFHDNEFYMYYAAPGSIGLAKSKDGFNFTKINNGIGGTSRVLEFGKDGEWDRHIDAGSVVYRKDFNEFWMYYSGCSERLEPHNFKCSTGLAKSKDLINWKKYEGNPIMSPSQDWEDHKILNPCVFFYDGKWRMFYRGGYAATPGRLLNTGISYAESLDGISWEKFEKGPVMRPKLLDEVEKMHAEIARKREEDYFTIAGHVPSPGSRYILDPWFIFKEGNPNNLGILYYTGVGTGNEIFTATQKQKGVFVSH